MSRIVSKVERDGPSFLGTLLTGGANVIATDLTGGYGYRATAVDTETGRTSQATGSTEEQARYNAVESLAKSSR